NVYTQTKKSVFLYNEYLIKHKFFVNEKLLYFLTTSIFKSIKLKFGYENKAGWDKVKKERIKLPTQNGEIDFDFMESFIAELEAERIAELSAYLTVSGMDNYELSDEERQAVEGLDKVEWGEYKVSELFTLQKITKMLSKEDLSDKYSFPAYSSESINNGIIGYTDKPEFICNDEHPVFVTFGDHTRTFNIAYNSFSVLDNVKVLLPFTNSYRALLWIITAWKKQIPNIGYARHWKIAKDCVVSLPTKNNQIDLEFMQRFISAIQKLAIKDVVLYTDKKIAAAKKVVEEINHDAQN
ncbi:MAG: restriction endonuclease subunit S, partial [Firmicutes bacterium]|nr:restriction endonuclease subunit S [Bacillota bacterium]